MMHLCCRVSGSILSSISRRLLRHSREEDQKVESGALEVIYLDSDFCIVNKPCDVRMDGEGFEVTVQSLVAEYLEKIGRSIQIIRFAHRLDYATSGCLCVALNKKAAGQAGTPTSVLFSRPPRPIPPARRAGDLFASRAAQKQYLALAYGHVREEGYLIDAPVAEYVPDAAAGEARMRPSGLDDNGRDFRMAIGTPANPGRAALTEVLAAGACCAWAGGRVCPRACPGRSSRP